MRRRRFLEASGVLLSSALLPAATQRSSSTLNVPPPIDLDGDWHRTPAHPGPPPALVASTSNAAVPGCWEAEGVSARDGGPFWYQREVTLPPGASAWRWWLECDAVAEECEAWLDGHRLGRHRGVWDAFALPLPDAAAKPGPAALSLRISKPVERDAVRGALYGFLPYVWGTWGGPWQSVRLRATGPVRIAAVRSFAMPVSPAPPASGADPALLDVEVGLEGESRGGRCHLRLEDAAGRLIAEASQPAAGAAVTFHLPVRHVERWHPGRPVLYRLTLSVEIDGRRSDLHARRIGFRDVRPDGHQIRVNGEAIYPRGVLSWGYCPEIRVPNPSPAAIRRELEQVRSLGYNMVKLCLWVAPKAYYEIADELGLLLWQELPLWAPASGEAFEQRVRQQYARIVAQRGDHPAVVIWTLGCELSKSLSSAFLGRLYRQVKQATRSLLVRDNSGSSETYDGPLPEHADFWDFHFYTDLPFFRPIVEAFAPGWRRPQPWLFGEFCDSDAFRDLPAVIAKEGATPWWASADPDFNPQGVRWDMNILQQMQRIRENGLEPHLDELRASGVRQAELIRKVTLEEARAVPFISGYTVTGLCDTPISSAGMLDYFGQTRFSPERFRRFNQDTVLFLEPYRSREWEHGGDRPRFRPRWNAWAGQELALQIGVSHFGPEQGTMQARWRIVAPDVAPDVAPEGAVLAQGETAARTLAPGTSAAVGWIRTVAPRLRKATQLKVEVELFCEGRPLSANDWPLFVYPSGPVQQKLALYDPAGIWADAESLAGFAIERVSAPAQMPAGHLLLATAWTPEWAAWVRAGGRMLLAAQRFSGVATQSMPFWREALRQFPGHASWGDFPHQGWTGLQFYGLASDYAFRWPLDGEWSGAAVEPVLTRVDARTYELASYAFAAHPGRGRVLATTLRFQGGLGDQPAGMAPATDFENVAASYLLRQWAAWLAG